ncbi:MAG: sigma 54-interacting transcriptional regulator, partial [Bdellovibrionales bacterium]|nr:sigma 54-interacting transcriptional regulator [Bdellovibrionales bacterium]
KNHDLKSRYLFKSLGKTPFRLNGIYCFEAFLERGDILDIGFNRIQFPRMEREVCNQKISEKLMRSQIGILIEGETGTGKTTLAKKIHEESGRHGRFVHLNLSSFSPSLIESELFGHVKGAFTGAINGKKGAILEAHKGTLFLDEIDSLTLDLQTKLLLFLDSYEVRSVGGENVSKADVRMIFASGSRLSKKVENGEMRRDFYFRLQAGVAVNLESLREKPERIVEICEIFENKEMITMSRDLLSFYTTCLWPGNIRQLQSHLSKKKIFSDGKKMIFDELDKELVGLNISIPKNERIEPLDKVKINYCYETFLRMDRNIIKTAKVLELCPNTLKAYLSKREEELRNHNVIHVHF